MQLDLPYALTDFEQATLEQLISYKAATEEDITRLMSSDKLIGKVKSMCLRWNRKRIELGLKTFK